MRLEIEALLSKRVILVTGKGGVGKTTIAASFARFAAAKGKRVLTAEIAADVDGPCSLAQALGAKEASEEPSRVLPNIQCALLTPSIGHRRFLQDTLPMKLVADAAMRSAAVRRFLAAAPAFSEMGVLYRILDLLRKKRADGSFEHEIAVLDCPATGHALAIAQLPEILLKIIPGGPIGKAVREGLLLLTDPRQTAALIVTLPETLPVSEAFELSAGLAASKVSVAGIVANRMPLDPFSREERAQVDAMLESAGPVLGQRALHKIDRAKEAAARLFATANQVVGKIDNQISRLPVYTVCEKSERGARLTESIARELDSTWDDPESQLGCMRR